MPLPQFEQAVRHLLHEGSVEVDNCTLVVNPQLDCVIGTDPLGIETVVAFATSAEACRDAVRWAHRVGPELRTLAANANEPSWRERRTH